MFHFGNGYSAVLSVKHLDPPELASRARKLMALAESGHVRLVLLPLTVAQVVWVLDSYYEYDRNQTVQAMASLVTSDGIDTEEMDIILEALLYYHDLNVDFIDAYLASHARRHPPTRIWTFDETHFRRFKEISVSIPE